MKIPTNGRQVNYHPTEQDRGVVTGEHKITPMAMGEDKAQPCTATVCYVHTPHLVNLVVIDHAGLQHRRPNVALLQDDDVASEAGGYAAWPTYPQNDAT